MFVFFLSLIKNLFFFFHWADMMWNGLRCSRCGLVVGRVSLCCSIMVVVLRPDTRVLGVLKPVVPIKDGKNGETARGWRSQASMLSPSQCVSKINGGPSTEYPFQLHFSEETLRRSVRFGSVSPCVYLETVILGRASPGSAGSAHWTKSSSGGRPESHPSWPIHYKEDRKKMQTEILFINDSFWEKHLHCASNAKQLLRFHVQHTCVNPLL